MIYRFFQYCLRANSSVWQYTSGSIEGPDYWGVPTSGAYYLNCKRHFWDFLSVLNSGGVLISGVHSEVFPCSTMDSVSAICAFVNWHTCTSSMCMYQVLCTRLRLQAASASLHWSDSCSVSEQGLLTGFSCISIPTRLTSGVIQYPMHSLSTLQYWKHSRVQTCRRIMHT